MQLTMNGRFFKIVKDYFGNWSIWNCDENGERVAGCPAFSVGHRTRKDAVLFLESFDTVMYQD